MDELATKLVDSLTKVENALETMAPTAFQALVEAAYITGVVDIIWGLVWLSIVAGAVVAVRHGFTRISENFDAGMAFMLSGGFVAIFGFVGTAVNLGASTTWLKIINPTAYVVKTLLAQ